MSGTTRGFRFLGGGLLSSFAGGLLSSFASGLLSSFARGLLSSFGSGGEIKSGASRTNLARQRGHLPDFPTSSRAPEMRWPQCGHLNLMFFTSRFFRPKNWRLPRLMKKECLSLFYRSPATSINGDERWSMVIDPGEVYPICHIKSDLFGRRLSRLPRWRNSIV